ncbi:ATP-dependent zinc metalloprotease FtsH [Urbifossiella limnaea]|uniref:ATP-dependent zinc metalloprotease FtsH n=1 Tax=Urbifossiella limnaea TaxID=2528023 RepID=A0A517XWZ8_9BACT|nr:ATP-dependent zinc metalloprotease FtsH [Urbifossiella limnaea]QDU22033.1 ATP-dependent zinc metalloprotease FtsH [Urbifossiella limnaea]
MPPPPTTPSPATKRGSPLLPGGWIALAVITVIAFVLYFSNVTKDISYTEFRTLVDAGQLKKLTFVGPDRLRGEVRDSTADTAKAIGLRDGKFTVSLPRVEDQERLVKDWEAKDKAYRDKLKEQKLSEPEPLSVDKREEPVWLGTLIVNVLFIGVALALFFFLILPRLRDPMGGGFLNNYVRSPAKRYEKGKGRLTFDDVAGMEGAKRELQEIVDYLKEPQKFTRLGAQVPKGVLLVGPPGTGKTLMAKAAAGEANVPFFSINGSEFIQMFVGVGASRVRDMFKTAKENSPCVIFIDEIDAVGRMRGAGVGGGSDEREQTLNQILSEMDGFQPTETVIVMAATNRPDVLDAALLRPGRFDRHITVDKPAWRGRLEILKVHTRNKPLADEVDLERIARNMAGMSGADLRNLCNEAALAATRAGKNKLEQVDFDEAADRVRLGAMREEPFSKDERRRTAVHEAGHALCAWLQPSAHKLDRVSIIPRARTGGVTMFQPNEDRVDQSMSELMAQLVMSMGGRAADKMVVGEPLSGAIGDLKHGTRLARLMVTQFGMSDRLGPVFYRQGEEHVFLGKDMHEPRDFSEGTAKIIDEEVQRIMTASLDRATELLSANRDKLDRLTEALLLHEELDADEVERVFAGVPLTEVKTDVPPAPPPAAEPAAEPAPDAQPKPGLAFG